MKPIKRPSIIVAPKSESSAMRKTIVVTTFNFRSYTNFHIIFIWTVQRVKESHRRKRKGGRENILVTDLSLSLFT